MKLLTQLWHDDTAAVVTSEMVLAMTIIVVGVTVGLTTLRDAMVTELADVGSAISCLNQSFSYSGVAYGAMSIATGSQFADGMDTCDDPASQPAGQNSRCVVICDIQAIAEQGQSF